MTGALTVYSIALKLDSRMAFEALILNRLGQLPKTRQPEWLRGLLVLGFVSECKTLRDVEPGVGRSAMGHRVVHQFRYDPAARQPGSDSRHRASADHESIRGRKPLAALRKVIG